MHFIVTGGAGFIGSHLVEQLLAEEHQVTIVDNLVTGSLSNLPESPKLKILIQNIADCKPQDFTQPIDGIAHLAATPSVTESWLNPLEAHHNNLSSILSVLLLCKALNIPRLVFASSAAVYGNPISVPISEEHPTHPISPYGLQKLVCEQYASLFAQQFGLSFVGLRLFNVFGPRQQPNSPYSGVISIFMSAAQQGLPITIYGDGSQTRDFVYVKDVASAFSQALTHPIQPGSSLICNIGTGTSISLIQLLEILKELFPKWQSEPQFSAARPGDIQDSRSDISKAITNFGFTPQWTIQTGLKTLVNTYSVH